MPLSPARFRQTDATFNTGFAFAAVQTLPAGVYLAMNGCIFAAGKVRRIWSRGVSRLLLRMEATMSCELCQQQGGELLWNSALCRVVLIGDNDYPGFCASFSIAISRK